MNIGFDLDKVFIDYPPFIPSWIIDRIYKEKENGVLLYRIPGKIEQKIRQISHSPLLRHPIKKNLQALHAIAGTKKYNMFLISSRFGFLKKQTAYIIKQYKLDTIFKQLHFNFNNEQPHIFKNRIIKNLHIDRYIDDDLSLLKFLAIENKKTLFFWLNNTLEKKISENLFAVKKIESLLHTV
jgi:hypothetical protein